LPIRKGRAGHRAARYRGRPGIGTAFVIAGTAVC
jgi:hypothetical protein